VLWKVCKQILHWVVMAFYMASAFETPLFHARASS
jgi:hypothetical protein